MSLSITINNFSPAPEKRFQEMATLLSALKDVERAIGMSGSTVTSGNINIPGSSGPVNVGTWTWTPQASS